MKVKLVVMVSIVIASIFCGINSIGLVRAIANSLQVRVTVVTTSSNGTYAIAPAAGATVKIVSTTNSSETYLTSADENGLAIFTIRTPSNYRINITYPASIYMPHEFYASPENYLTIYEQVWRLAVFSRGDQITRFKVLELSLPASVAIYLPSFDYFNATVNSYGLGYTLSRAREDEYPKWWAFTPKDNTDPKFDPTTSSMVYPNYTVSVEFRAADAGDVNIIAVSNGTIISHQAPAYHIPKEAVVQMVFVILVKRLPFLEQIIDLRNDLDFIKVLLMEIKGMLNLTVIPGINAINQVVPFYYNLTKDILDKGFGGYNLGMIYDSVTGIDTEVRRLRDLFTTFTSSFQKDVDSTLNKYIGTFVPQLYLLVGVIVVFAIITLVGVVIIRRKSPRKAVSVLRTN